MSKCQEKAEKYNKLKSDLFNLKTKIEESKNETEVSNFMNLIREVLDFEKEVSQLERIWHPEGGVYYDLETDPTIQTPEQAIDKLESRGIYVSDIAKDLLNKTEFSQEQQKYNLVEFTVSQLGFPNGETTAEIIGTEEDKDENGNSAPYTSGAMTKLGLELCPPEVGPQLRLSYPEKDWKLIAMKQITDRGGYPRVFYLYFDDDRLELGGGNAGPSGWWDGDSLWVFRFRK